MPRPGVPSLRSEIHNFVLSNERLLSTMSSHTSTPLSQEEVQIVKYYVVELTKSLMPLYATVETADKARQGALQNILERLR
ncbi:hypothetical protein W02_10430 [Nitrospira sp. KM1]|uniref:hypothetical protein n=1 Tax=Nitrospira sp. KM1 TaxID=1936990 RepID=UPI0013A7910D|nr:hypothetical protein [Nitrospira sp. KM1]BCA53903.1 hypothetical protein W02_10430 [Nitrospira sp. KM1]